VRISFHGALLAVLTAVLVIMAVGPARQLWDEHAQIRADQNSLAAGNAKATELTGRIEALQNPVHIEQLARDQLGYVRPGETLYIVGQPQARASTAAPQAAAAPAPRHRSLPDLLWTGVRVGLPAP